MSQLERLDELIHETETRDITNSAWQSGYFEEKYDLHIPAHIISEYR
jgi:hypothetical protein